MKIYIIIPTYNERENIVPLIEELLALPLTGLQIIIVDDNSPDGTAQAVKDVKTAQVQIIERSNKLGLGSAYIAGFKQALAQGADYIFEMDADFSHQPADVGRLLAAVRQDGYDVALGSRRVAGGNVEGWNFFRNLQSRAAMQLARLVLGLTTRDVTTGFRCYRRQVLESLALDEITSNGYAFQEEMIWLIERKGYKIKEVPITFIDRRQGKSKLSLKDIIEFFLTIIRLRLRRDNAKFH